MAGERYGRTFARRDDLPRPHPDTRVWTAADGGTDHGELYVDPSAREDKSGGVLARYARTTRPVWNCRRRPDAVGRRDARARRGLRPAAR